MERDQISLAVERSGICWKRGRVGMAVMEEVAVHAARPQAKVHLVCASNESRSAPHAPSTQSLSPFELGRRIGLLPGEYRIRGLFRRASDIIWAMHHRIRNRGVRFQFQFTLG